MQKAKLKKKMARKHCFHTSKYERIGFNKHFKAFLQVYSIEGLHQKEIPLTLTSDTLENT